VGGVLTGSWHVQYACTGQKRFGWEREGKHRGLIVIVVYYLCIIHVEGM